MSDKKDLLMDTLHKYYKNKKHRDLFLRIISGGERVSDDSQSHKLSLRIIDYFIIKYAQSYDTYYFVSKGGKMNTKSKFRVYESYKLQLRGYSKKYFDPFCRGKRIALKFDQTSTDGTDDNGNKKKVKVLTTIGQLNFFRWSIKNGIIDYIKRHYTQIVNDMSGSGDDKSETGNDTLDVGHTTTKSTKTIATKIVPKSTPSKKPKKSKKHDDTKKHDNADNTDKIE